MQESCDSPQTKYCALPCALIQGHGRERERGRVRGRSDEARGDCRGLLLRATGGELGEREEEEMEKLTQAVQGMERTRRESDCYAG